MEEALSLEIKKLASIFNKHDVKYMFIGGVAVAFYAAPRPSGNLPKGIDYDVDIWYLGTIKNFSNITLALVEYENSLKEDLSKIVFDPKRTFLKFNIRNIHFDLLPEVIPFVSKDFDKCYKKCEMAEFDGIDLPIISKEDLIANKNSLNRPKDKEDIKNINKNSYKGFSR
jgi:predicted nucleotidyltransferase